MADRTVIFSLPEGGEFVATCPETLTLDTISMLEEVCVLMFRRMKRTAEKVIAEASAEAEYQSWFVASKDTP